MAQSLSDDVVAPVCTAHSRAMERFVLFTRQDGSKSWSKFFCQACKAEEERTRRADEELAQRRERETTLLARSGLQGRYLDATFDSFVAKTEDQRKVLAACRQYAENLNRQNSAGLWLIGPVGTGKTHLGAAMVNHLIRVRGVPARIASSRQLIRDLRGTWRKDSSDSEDDVIQDYGRMPLLILDEVGVAFGTEAEQTQLFDVIDLRYQLSLPTVLLSNLPPAGLKAWLGDRLFDRLREDARVLICEWASFRGPGA